MTNINLYGAYKAGVKFGTNKAGFPKYVPPGGKIPAGSKLYNGQVRFPNRGGAPTVIPAGQLPPAGKETAPKLA